MSSCAPLPGTPRLISTSSSVALASTPSMPTNATSPAVALRVVKVRAVALLPSGNRSLMSARPKSTSAKARPMRSGLLPLTPAKASSPLPPTVSRSAAITVGARARAGSSERTPSLRVSSVSLRSMANCPATWKKPNTSRLSSPAARVSSPSAPSSVISMLLSGPVATVSAVRRSLCGSPGSLRPKSTTASPSLAARLMSICRSRPWATRPSMPTRAALSARACSAVQLRSSFAVSL